MYILLIQNTKELGDSTFFKCSSISDARRIASNYDPYIYRFEIITDYKSLNL